MPKKYFTVEYTTEQYWGVVVEADNEEGAEDAFNNQRWHYGPNRIDDVDTIKNVEVIYESNSHGGAL